MPAEPTRYFDRYSRTFKIEAIYGERWLRLAYENPAGRLLVWLLIRRRLFSAWYGRKMRGRWSSLQILPFIEKYGIDVDEFAKSPFDYRNFNEFFIRQLRPECRPIAAGEKVAVFPADGRHLVFANMEQAGGFYVKGAQFGLEEFLGEDAKPAAERTLSRMFAGGSIVISRLCPTDYHRFHFPVDGTPGETSALDGWLYSVHPVALRRNIRYLVRNKREITLVDSPAFGSVAMVEVGATNVGTIRQTFVPGRAVPKGAEKGLFAFGGSCVVTLFQRGRIKLDDDLLEQSVHRVETYARMGDRLGAAP